MALSLPEEVNTAPGLIEAQGAAFPDVASAAAAAALAGVKAPTQGAALWCLVEALRKLQSAEGKSSKHSHNMLCGCVCCMVALLACVYSKLFCEQMVDNDWLAYPASTFIATLPLNASH